jgi:hypothetical protein
MEVLFSAMIEERTERMHTQISKKYYPFTNIRDTYFKNIFKVQQNEHLFDKNIKQ